VVSAAALSALRLRQARRRLRIAVPPPNATVDAAYEADIEVRGGLAPYDLTVVGGALPDGLSVSGVTLSGTPTEAGTSRITFLIADANGVERESATYISVVEAA
jgi:hypothetical protein